MAPELSLDEIAELIHEYHGLLRKGYLPEGSLEMRRLSGLNYTLKQITLTGEQIMEMQRFDPLVLGNNDVKRSAIYGELQEEHERLQRRYDKLEERYHGLVRRIKQLFGSQFELKDLIEKQRKEAERDYL